MGFDRIRFFDTKNGDGTLIGADKASAQTVFGYNFGSFLKFMGYQVRKVVDSELLPGNEYYQGLRSYSPTDFPVKAQQDWWPGSRCADVAVEVKPPLSEDATNMVLAYLTSHCNPNDEGPLYFDYRGSDNERQMHLNRRPVLTNQVPSQSELTSE